jgi:small subunit ribosomal protein S9
MADEPKKDIETPAEGSEAEAAGPVAGEAEGETPSTEESAAGPVAQDPPPAHPPEPDPAHHPQTEAPRDGDDTTAEAEEPEAAAEETDEPEAEEPVAAAEETDEPEAAEEPPAEKKKKDVIPGADLEPIAVEPEERPLSAEEKARLEAEEEEKARREAVLPGDEEEEQTASRAPAKIEGDSRFLATGKRKHSIARVTLLPGGGSFQVNGRPLEEFFPRPLHQTIARQPLAITGYEGNVDVRVRVHGGGVSGQAGAVRHGIARALIEVDPELRGELKRRGFLTRDARVKERRKAGLKKARKRPQFSKR